MTYEHGTNKQLGCYGKGMTASVCAALTSVFPLILLTVILEGRGIGRARKTNLYTWPVAIGSMVSLAGLLLSLVGVQTDGLIDGWAVTAWAFVGIGLASLLAVTFLLALSYDEEDGRGMKLFGRTPLPVATGSIAPASHAESQTLSRVFESGIFFFEIQPDSIANLHFWKPVAFHDVAFIAQNGEGWEPVTFAFTPTAAGKIMVSLMMKREVPSVFG